MAKKNRVPRKHEWENWRDRSWISDFYMCFHELPQTPMEKNKKHGITSPKHALGNDGPRIHDLDRLFVNQQRIDMKNNSLSITKSPSKNLADLGSATLTGLLDSCNMLSTVGGALLSFQTPRPSTPATAGPAALCRVESGMYTRQERKNACCSEYLVQTSPR